MAPFEFDEDIPLTVRLLKNDKALTGQTVTVRVVDDDAIATERLAETSTPETAEPGVYTFLWTTAPSLELNLIAIFEFGNAGNKKTTSEFIKIRKATTSQDGGSILNVVEIEVVQDPIVSIETSQAVVEILVN